MTIFSAGCSFSDGWEGATPFGQIIANKFDQDWNRDAVETQDQTTEYLEY